LQKDRFIPFLLLFLVTVPVLFAYPCKAQIIEDEWVIDIEDYAYAIDLNTTGEIVVVVLPSLSGHGVTDKSGNEIHDIVQLGVQILNEEPLEVWDGEQTGIGKSGKDNGVLVLVALEEQQWRIEVGYGLEGDITDVEANLIAQEYLVPLFQQGNYGEGLYYTVVAIGDQIPSATQVAPSVRGIYYYESDSTPVETPAPFWDYYFYGMPLWLIILLAVLGIFVPVAGRGRIGGGRSGGGGAGGRW
jgi:uncharacterized protein